MTRVLGADPSLSGTGLCWADNATSVCGGTGDQRLWVIYRSVLAAAVGADDLTGFEGRADLAVVEDLPTHGMGAGKTGMAQGAVRLALQAAGVPYALVAPASLKKYATGSGNATKPDMRMALYCRFGLDLRSEDAVDAWWLRAMGMDWLGSPLVELPKTHRVALDKVVWPALGSAA